VPYNLELERRLDQLAGRFGAMPKKKMFGGVCYLLNGNMVFGIHKQSLIIRTSPEKAEALLKRDFVSIFDITGRPMKGWILVSPRGVETDKQLLDFLNIGFDYAKTLPKK
jgi:hypothetical protein